MSAIGTNRTLSTHSETTSPLRLAALRAPGMHQQQAGQAVGAYVGCKASMRQQYWMPHYFHRRILRERVRQCTETIVLA